MGVYDRFRRAWNAFNNKDPTMDWRDVGAAYAYRPDRPVFTKGNERSIVTSVLNRMAIDAAAVTVKHVQMDENDRYTKTIKSPLNECLTVDANTDQTGRAFIQDAVMSMLDEGCVAIVPVSTSPNPMTTDSYKIYALRTARVVQWYPEHVTVSLYNERLGRREEIRLPKKMVAIVENPWYAVMNEQSSTMQRLIRTMNRLDAIDEQSSSGKLDLIIQLPYVIKSEARRIQANERRKQIEEQLAGSKYGIAYTDGTERITQLNRSVENNLMTQIEYLTSMLYSQLGITQAIMDGTADEQTMQNYYSRTIEPILTALVDEMKRKFLSADARKRYESIEFFRNPLKMVPVSKIADISDKLTRNEIASSNEMRQVIGWKPSSDPRADELRNKNLSDPDAGRNTASAEQNQNEEKEADEE